MSRLDGSTALVVGASVPANLVVLIHRAIAILRGDRPPHRGDCAGQLRPADLFALFLLHRVHGVERPFGQ
jgi:hypothetical protein